VIGELHGGHQSRVYRARRKGGEYVAKLTDQRFVDEAYFARLELASHLASVDSTVVGPRRVRGSLSRELGEWFVVAYPIVQGRTPDHGERADVTAMALALASLHRSLRSFVVDGIPRVAALRSTAHELPGSRPDQLLHGDFGSSNVFATDSGMRIIDFDDAGWGPVEFEIGNTLYMALFDASLHDDLDGYMRFREWFVDGYGDAAADRPRLDIVDAAITLRKQALASWLDDLPNAPPGIRSASPEWRRLLRRFSTTP
jgi:Ser/Thr protein kinase RdoA (MazF antagonist)